MFRALVPHLVDIPPIPPPHGPTAPSFRQSVRVAGFSVCHGDDGLSVVFVAMTKGTLSFLQFRRLRDDAAILRHGAKPFAFSCILINHILKYLKYLVCIEGLPFLVHGLSVCLSV